MLTYLEKFNSLPVNIRKQVSAPEVMMAIQEIGKRYQINLANIVMRVMIKEIDVRALVNYFVDNHGFEQTRAQHLENELKEKVFADVINYLYRKPLLEDAVSKDGVPLTLSEDEYRYHKIDKVLKGSGISLSSADLEKRLRGILFTYLKQVRDKLATIDALTKAIESGGIGFDKQSAVNLITLIDSENKADGGLEVHSPAKIPVIEDKVYSRDVDYDLVKELAKKREVKPVEIVKPAEVASPVEQQVIKDVKKIAPPPPAIRPQLVKKVIPKPQPKKKIVPQAKPIDMIRKTETGKVKMDDIRTTPKVFTPVDELRYMTLKNFRNLDEDPYQAIEKIKDKLQALKDDDYGKMVSGVKAWKVSPVNKLYLSVYQAGLNEGKPAMDILQEKIEKNDSFLTEQEFEAIIKLNQELKF